MGISFLLWFNQWSTSLSSPTRARFDNQPKSMLGADDRNGQNSGGTLCSARIKERQRFSPCQVLLSRLNLGLSCSRQRPLLMRPTTCASQRETTMASRGPDVTEKNFILLGTTCGPCACPATDQVVCEVIKDMLKSLPRALSHICKI